MADREKVVRSVESCFDYWLDQHRCLHTLELDKVRQMKSDAIAMLKEQEIVRCKDCIHYRYYGLTKETVSECTIDHCENQDKDWFCADGERKEGR